MRILVTGAKGQLGVDVVDKFSTNNEVIGLGVNELDITSIDNVMKISREINPDVIINCAAYTNVDGCENDVDLAYKINAIGARNIAVAALETNSKLVHISTDFVFDGMKNSPYIEFDQASPLGIYGASKFAGEKLIKDISSKHFVLRTSWLYGNNGNNFVKTMLKLSKENKTLRVVDDQIGTPTFTKDLVDVIDKVIKTDAYGTYHTSNNGACTWNEFAKTIFNYAGVKDIEVLPITSDELNRAAKRPSYSVLKNYMLELQFGLDMREWKEALHDYFKCGK